MQQRTPSPSTLDYSPAPAKSGAGRWIVAVIECGVSWAVGMVVGAFAAKVYERAMYPPEPDPVHFDVGGVFLLAWFLIGLVGSVFFIGRAVRNGRSPAA